MKNRRFAVVDVETTGNSPKKGEKIIQIAIVIVENGEIQQTYSSFIHPKKEIPLFIQEFTSITNEDVQHAPTFDEEAQTIRDLLQGSIFVAHNTNFDLGFIQAEIKAAGLPKWSGQIVDTVELSRLVYPTAPSYKLQEITDFLSIPLQQAHRADEDATATAKLLVRCMNRLNELPKITLEWLHKKSFLLKTDLMVLIYDALVKKRNGHLHDEKVNLLFEQIAVKVDTQNQNTLSVLQTHQNVDEIVHAFYREFPHYEKREEQQTMMQEIWQSVRQGKELVIEAPTGIGKTLGYLLPAITHALNEKKPAVISTNTNYLQDQLVENELPKLEQFFQNRLQTVLLKGRDHFIDLDLFYQYLQEELDSYDDNFTLLQLLIWLTETSTGDLEEVNFSSGGSLFVDKIRKRSSYTSEETNPFDFYNRMRQKIQHADCIITNHATLLADEKLNDYLTEHASSLIIDEAHQLISVAYSINESNLSFVSWKYMFGQIGTSEKQQLIGQLVRLFHDLEPYVKTFDETTNHLHESYDEFVEKLISYVMVSEIEDKNVKLTYQLKQMDEFHHLIYKLYRRMNEWIEFSEQLLARLRYSLQEFSLSEKRLIEEWNFWIAEMKIKRKDWVEIFMQSNDDQVVWIELDKRSIPGSLSIYKKRLSTTPFIEQALNQWKKNLGVIWTSSTLTVPNQPHFLLDQLAIPSQTKFVQLSPTAKFYEHAKTFIVKDMPAIQHVSQKEYVEAVIEAIESTVTITNGKCFVLFTSLEMIKQTVEVIQEQKRLENFMVVAQGVTTGSKSRMMKTFLQFEKTILFGTSTFWEGVDVPGDSLHAVLVVRLPFSSPDDPFFKARLNDVTQSGKNSFVHLSLPDALIRFRQGFGRLIRRSGEKGAFIILDNRIHTKSYGKEFLRILPNIEVRDVTLSDMEFEIEHWYNNEG